MDERERASWMVDQIAKSEFFHQKLHEWGLLEIAQEIEDIRGEDLNWDLDDLNISDNAWNKVIHRGIKPIVVFCHPAVIVDNPKRISYYRMLSMVSQKSMNKIGMGVTHYELGKRSIDARTAWEITRRLNHIISVLIEGDDILHSREFDIWRGMAAGSQAQGSWQNAKGDKEEVAIKQLIIKRCKHMNILATQESEYRTGDIHLNDGRTIRMGSEPDVAIYDADDRILLGIEIKGGIDTAGALERFGAALKSLRRVKQENPSATTVLIMRYASITAQVKREIKQSSEVIDHFFVMEDIIDGHKERDAFFVIVGI